MVTTANDDHRDFPTLDIPQGCKISYSKTLIYLTLDSANQADRERFHRFMHEIGQAHDRRIPDGRLEIRIEPKHLTMMPEQIKA